MSALKTKFMDDMKTALRAHDTARLNTVRFLLSELKNWEIDHGEQDDAGVQAVIAREVKKQKDALNDFKNAGRADLVTEVEAKIVVMESYLPKQLSDEELQKIVQKELAASEKKDFGAVMKAVMAQVKGQADGARVSALVKASLE